MDPFIECFGLWEDFHSKLIGEMERLLSSLVPDRKRQFFLRGLAHFVELDLLRSGRRMPMAGRGPDSPYYLLVCRKHDAPRCSVWPAHFLRPLPPLSIPLAAPDPDVTLAVQPLVEAVYARSHYDRGLDYSRPLHPPLCPADATWLEERLGEQG